MMSRVIQFLGQPRAPRRVAPAAMRGPMRKAHEPVKFAGGKRVDKETSITSQSVPL